MYVYFNNNPELQERLSIIATMNDYAEGTVKQKVKAREDSNQDVVGGAPSGLSPQANH
jgi:hypothetical protein